MIIVEGWIKLSDGDVDKVRDAAMKMMEETRKEEGCLLYIYSTELANPNTIRIAERWESMEALQAHGKTPHMEEFNKAMAGATTQGASVKAYTADEAATLIGGDEAYG